MLTKLLQQYLYILAKLTLWRYQPKIVAITGNIGKTSTKDAIVSVLQRHFSVRGSEKNYNNEVGVPLTILGEKHHGKNVFKWIVLFFRVVFFKHQYPRVLVLEMGADRPGDIRYLGTLARPDIAVVTGVGEIPVHVEFFPSADAVREEKADLVRAVLPSGYAVLNADDPRVLHMKQYTEASVVTFGIREHADAHAENAEIRYREENGIKIPEGLSFKISYQGSVIPVRLSGSLGTPQILSAASAFLVGTLMEINPVEVAEALAIHKAPPGRMRILKGNKGSIILDDTYNAAPAAMEVALETLLSILAHRKIAVLGDMLELGEYTEEAHRRIGRRCASIAHELFLVGERTKFILDEALAAGFPSEHVRHFSDSREVKSALEPMLERGDIVLVKGSQGMRMERVVEAIMAEPENVKDLLVRQSVDWRKRV